MTSTLQGFVDDYGVTGGPVEMAHALMAGDRSAFKAGYTAENAYIAVVGMARRDGVAINEGHLATELGVDAVKLEQAIR
jgi:hypothetical protein